MNLYPLKFHPIPKERIWGGHKLRDVLNKPFGEKPVGESWELSGVKDSVSIVSNGMLTGTSLNEILRAHAARLVGTKVKDRFGMEFPVLVKFLDARKDLSIQVHPNDELAGKRHNSHGKTEMWYILDTDKEARLIIGFDKTVSRAEYRKSLENDTITQLLHYVPVTEGDTFYIHPGKIHAIGAGVLLAEIQQTSDITYRVYDYNRTDPEGNYRDLHTELALDALDYERKDDFKVDYSLAENTANRMVDSAHFTTRYLNLTKEMDIRGERDSFSIYICVSGMAEVSNPYGTALLTKGETVLVPAASEWIRILTSGAKLLEVTL